MSASEKEKLMMAYLDGQMSAAEASAFDESLLHEERDRLAAEMRIETVLAEAITAGADCPEDLWRRIQFRMRNENTRARLHVTPLRTMLAAAASLLIAGTIYFGIPVKEDARLVALAETVEELAASAEVPPDTEALEQFLRQHGIEVFLESFETAHPESRHRVTLLGARERQYNKEPTAELLYSCCGCPVRVVLARSNSASAKQLAKATNLETVQRVDQRENYVAGVISAHRAGDLADAVHNNPSV